MESYIDIHSHILPGLDDGAKNFEMSLRMLHQAAAEHIEDIILTPHYKPMRHNMSPDSVKKLFQSLEEKKKEAGISIRLHLGNEIYYSSETVPALREGKALALAASSYVLAEFSPKEDYSYIRDAVYNLLSEGYLPILAHVERYGILMAKKAKVEELYDMGCYFQVNASSITGNNGRESKRDVKWLLKREYVHFVASDSHDDSRRMPRLAEAAAYVARKCGEEYCCKIFKTNADAVLCDRYL